MKKLSNTFTALSLIASIGCQSSETGVKPPKSPYSDLPSQTIVETPTDTQDYKHTREQVCGENPKQFGAISKSEQDELLDLLAINIEHVASNAYVGGLSLGMGQRVQICIGDSWAVGKKQEHSCVEKNDKNEYLFRLQVLYEQYLKEKMEISSIAKACQTITAKRRAEIFTTFLIHKIPPVKDSWSSPLLSE